MAERGGLVVYVTSHGFGHLNRAAAVINRVPGSVPVTVHRAYRHATAVFRAEPALRLAEFDRARVEEVGMVVTPGRDRRAELRAALGLSAAEKLVYFYVGRYGQADLGWERVAALGRKGV